MTTIDGRFELQQVLAEGGMSRVWKARDLRQGDPVALKIPRQRWASDPATLERFRREARALLGLSHPNLVHARASGEWNGLPYLAMDFVEGEDLRHHLSRRRLSRSEVISIARQVLSALEYAHGRGIVHRDISARNVMLEPNGNVRLTDFGIARAAQDVTLTQAGMMVGSVLYMAPEQALGEGAEATSDVYSVGVLLYEMLTGGLPFVSDNPIQVALKHVQQPAPRLPAEFGADLGAIVARALAKDPRDRFASAAEMDQALTRLQVDHTRPMEVLDATLVRPAVQRPAPPRPAAPPSRPAPRRRPALGLAALVGVALALLVAFLALPVLVHPPDPPVEVALEVQRAPATPEEAQAEPEPPADEPRPVDPHLLNEEGYRLLKAGRYAEAIPLLRDAVEAYPVGSQDLNYGYALFNLAHAYRMTGRAGAAIPLLEERLRIPNQEAEVRKELALARKAAGR